MLLQPLVGRESLVSQLAGRARQARAVGGENASECIPFVSQYSDCSEANYCSGCTTCRCTENGKWFCEKTFSCPENENEDEYPYEEETIKNALDTMINELGRKETKESRPLVPPPPGPEDELLGKRYKEDFETFLWREKRSIKDDSKEKSNKNATIKFFDTVDDINEDTLKNSNKTGTIEANKVQAIRRPKITRRAGLLDNFNTSSLSSLHIQYNEPEDYDHHIIENKIDTTSHVKNKLDENDLQKLMGNYSQSIKNGDLSKLVVNELKVGNEIIGDKRVLPTSNITFTPENDTLTAMTFIAGNLLSKLWNMEKDASEDSIETEMLKHEKINDLLELFKEPLSIRQETFLKNALEKLSDTLNKNKSVKNISICETITDSEIFHTSAESIHKDNTGKSKIIKTKCNHTDSVHKFNEKKNQYNVSLGVLSKLNNVLGLLKKFESVQKNLSDLKHLTSIEQLNANYDIEENTSVLLFGDLLDKITKLLIPNKHKNKKMLNKLKKSNQFGNEGSINKFFEKRYNLNLGKINITTKDKIILDYLNHIESNPNCLFRNNLQKKTDNLNSNIERNILYNLSEFFKIKSFMDLIKLTRPEFITEKQTKSTTEYPRETTTTIFLRNSVIDQVKKLNNTKEKLKSHLRAIIEDLLQLQKEQGVNNVKDINIVDALPCIYNILNTDKVLNEQGSNKSNLPQVTHLNKMKALINTLKSELTATLPMRRNIGIAQERPKSATVWERIIKNINTLHKKTRRNFHSETPKTYEQLEHIMEQVYLMGNTYKNFAMLSVTPRHELLMLLKTLEADTKQQSSALTKLYNSMETVDMLPLEKRNDVKEFVDNVENNIRLSAKVLENLFKSKQNRNKKSNVLINKTSKFLHKQKFKIPKSPNLSQEFIESNDSISTDQVLVHLMMNRVRFYLTLKEASETNINDDINYNIGKRILFLIQNGNLDVAKELFKIFVANKQEEEKLSHIKDSTSGSHTRKRPPLLLALKEPVINFDGPGKEIVQKQDPFYKQL